MVPYFGWALSLSVSCAIGGLCTLDEEIDGDSERGREINGESEADPRDAPDCSLVPIVLPRSHESAPQTSSGGSGEQASPIFYPRSVSVSLCWSPSISKILIVLSDEQVARRRP